MYFVLDIRHSVYASDTLQRRRVQFLEPCSLAFLNCIQLPIFRGVGQSYFTFFALSFTEVMFQGEALLVWAFMGWKYRQETNKWNNQKNWHNELFKRMQANAGCLCNWKNPILGTEFVTQCCSYCTLWLPYALSVAAAVDFLFGEISREMMYSRIPSLRYTSDDEPLQWLPNPF